MTARTMVISAVMMLMTLVTVDAHCPNYCSGHGECSFDRTMKCTCFSGWMGPDCSLRTCSSGLSWIGFSETTDGLHSQEAECSAMGICNRQTGLCDCNSGFEGLACEKMSCPNACSGHGQCMTVGDAGSTIDGRLLTIDTTYSNWDAQKVQGCVCDAHYHGHDCALRSCPTGDDPDTTGQVDEIQVINCLCDTCSGYFHVTFRGETTGRIAHNAVATIDLEDSDVRTAGIGAGESIQAKLEALTTLNGVTITLTSVGGGVCGSDTPATEILFNENGGDLPSIEVTSFLVAGVGSVGLSVDHGGTGSSVDGTTEDAVCSNRGICDESRGICSCFPGYGSSDGDGNNGTLPDCGARNYETDYLDCPNGCQSRGDCDLASLTCTCYSGFTGGDCSLRECPFHNAWFDEPFAQDQAHAPARCSNMGKCNYNSGECVCQSGFTGAACQRMECVGSESLRPCNQRGRCLSNKELARVGTINGEFIGQKEVQNVTCFAATGTFTLSFRRTVTNALAYDADEATVRTALEALVTVGLVTVNYIYPSTGACSTDGSSMLITFDYNFGDLDLMEAATSSGDDILVEEVVQGSRVTYGETEGNSATWDADMIHGCLCDGTPNLNKTLPTGDTGFYIDYACSQRSCPYGHDVLLLEDSPLPTIQSFTCFLTTGSFVLEFRGQRTDAIAFDASEDDIKTALQSIHSIGLVDVTFITGLAPCDASGADTYIMFATELDELPLLKAFPSTNELADMSVSLVQNTNTTSTECASRGICDRELGVCKCFTGFVSGDGFGGRGGRGDCGTQDPLFVASP